MKTLLGRSIFDATASKRIVKTGFVGLPGGIYIHDCDSIAAHSNTVAILSTIIAFEFKDEIKKNTDIDISLEEVILMATFHDYGETKSGDTGAQSKGIYPTQDCKLHYLERDGLQTCMSGLKAENKVLESFDNYRKYLTPEAIIVHIADNLEGFEKAMSSSRGMPAILNVIFKIIQENLEIYARKKDFDKNLGTICDILVNNALLPGIEQIYKAYGYKESIIEILESNSYENISS